MDFKFTNDFSTSRHDEILDHLLKPRLWIPSSKDVYPEFDDWANRAHKELHQGKKRAMVAYHLGKMIGVIIYQRHKSDEQILELKNVSILPENRGRYVASFLLRQVEIEGALDFKGVTQATCDAKVENRGILKFFRAHGYEVSDPVDLYNKNAGLDVIYRRSISKNYLE